MFPSPEKTIKQKHVSYTVEDTETQKIIADKPLGNLIELKAKETAAEKEKKE